MKTKLADNIALGICGAGSDGESDIIVVQMLKCALQPGPAVVLDAKVHLGIDP